MTDQSKSKRATAIQVLAEMYDLVPYHPEAVTPFLIPIFHAFEYLLLEGGRSAVYKALADIEFAYSKGARFNGDWFERGARDYFRAEREGGAK